jgi:hypothetical protein
MTRSSRLLTGLAVLAALALSACAPSSYAVKAPKPSGLKYSVAETPAAKTFSLIDERRADGRVFSSGTLQAELKIDGQPLDPVPFLAGQLQAELASRGLPVAVSKEGTAVPAIRLKTYRMQNMRTNAYTPFITLTYISADVDTDKGSRRIGVFVTRGKTPVWSFDELIEPTLNQPLALGVQEFASKIANLAYGYRASDDEVKRLTEKVNGSRNDNTFLDVYALGFTNHPAAIDTLIKLAHDKQEYVRQAAISSLGTLGAASQFGLLKSIYQDSDASWQDRSIAIKAIADLGTPEAMGFVAAEAKRAGKDTSSKESAVLAQVLALYL